MSSRAKLWPLLAVIAVCALGAVQDPPPAPKPATQEPQRPAPPPPDARPLPTVDEPYVSPVPRNDLIQRFDRPDPIEGFYELRSRMVHGAIDPQGSRGWLVVGKRHLIMYLQAHGTDARIPLLRAGARKWRRSGETLLLTGMGGHYTEPNGDVVVEGDDLSETRRVEILGSILRVYQDGQSWLDFVRIE